MQPETAFGLALFADRVLVRSFEHIGVQFVASSQPRRASASAMYRAKPATGSISVDRRLSANS